MSDQNKKQQLVEFLDRKAFDPILHTSPDRYDESDRKKLEDVKRSTESEKDRYHNQYKSAREVYDRYHDDLSSDAAKKVNRELKQLELPTLPDLREDFDGLAERIGVK